MIRRPRRSVPATVVALVLLAVCAGVAVAVVQSLLGRTPFVELGQVLSVTSALSWNSVATVAAAVVLAVLGLILLVSALSPGPPTVLPLARMVGPDGGPAADAGVHRSTLDKDLTTVVDAVPGVTRASVRSGRRAVTATVSVAVADRAAAATVTDTIRARLTERLADIAPAPKPSVRVRTRTDAAS